jgi:transcriptional regulator
MRHTPHHPLHACGTVAIRLRVTQVDARAKLSQDKPADAVERIIDERAGDGPYSQPDLAREMRRHRDSRDS